MAETGIKRHTHTKSKFGALLCYEATYSVPDSILKNHHGKAHVKDTREWIPLRTKLR